MADLFFLLVYLGGGFAISDQGFWRAVLWPYHLGRRLGTTALKEQP